MGADAGSAMLARERSPFPALSTLLMILKSPFFVLLLPLLVSACDPCTGLGRCGSPQIRYEGELTRQYSEAPADGIRVEFVRTGGVALEEAVIVAETNRDGLFHLHGRALASGEVVGDLFFYPPPPLARVQVEDVRLTTAEAAGELRFAGSWSIPFPYLPYEVHFYERGTRQPAAGLEVEFRRTGGIRVEPDTFRVTTNPWGTVKLRPLTREVGELLGELVVHPLPPYRSYTIPNLRMATFGLPRLDSTLISTGVGPHMPYAGLLVREDGAGISNMKLEFRRTGGVPMHPDPFPTSTDFYGTFWINPVPLAAGAVEGELIVTEPGEEAGRVAAVLRLDALDVDIGVHHLGYFTLPRP